jgi:recombination protein U
MKAVRQANRGRALEELIILANQQYRAQGIAVIHKVPTAWLPIRDNAGRIVSAKVEEKAAVDFLGVYRGRPIGFDAKQCSGDRIRWDRVEPHQALFLQEWEKSGGIGFIFVGFNFERFYVVPWQFWQERMQLWHKKEGLASITATDMKPEWETKNSKEIALNYLETVDNLWPTW